MTKKRNQLKELVQPFNRTVTSIDVGTSSSEDDSHVKIVLSNENGLFLWGSNNISQFEDLVRDFLNCDSEISSSLSEETVKGIGQKRAI